jgi:hypothetical protein
MKYLLNAPKWIYFILILPVTASCNYSQPGPSKEAIRQVNLKRGAVISCGG